jgi:polyisoprenoid-binding protein YceI
MGTHRRAARLWRLRALRLALMSTWMLGAAAQAAPARYLLDPERSFVHFEVRHFGTSTTRGRIGPFYAEVMLDREAGRGEVNLRVRTDTVSTGMAVFDARLREPDLLASEQHPEAFFVATDFRFVGDSVSTIRGEFTLRGQSAPLELRALRFGCRTDTPDAREVCGGDFEGFVKRSDFGLSFGVPFVADQVRLVVSVEGARR